MNVTTALKLPAVVGVISPLRYGKVWLVLGSSSRTRLRFETEQFDVFETVKDCVDTDDDSMSETYAKRLAEPGVALLTFTETDLFVVGVVCVKDAVIVVFDVIVPDDLDQLLNE